MKGLIKFLAVFVGLVGILGGVMYAVYVDVWQVPLEDPAITAAIVPALEPGDFVLIAKDSLPDIPDLARCTDPDAPERFVIGRLMAKNGDPLSINNDIVNSRGRRAPSPRRCEQPVYEITAPSGEKRLLDCWEEDYADRRFTVLRGGERPAPNYSGEVEMGKVFLVSDDRPVHNDSRDFGAIDPKECRRIYARLWGKDGILHPLFSWVW
jgi:signal peptidase I